MLHKQLAAPDAQAIATAAPVVNRQIKILIVDDQEDQIKLATEALSALPGNTSLFTLDIKTAQNLDDADNFLTIDHFAPDYIFLDINLGNNQHGLAYAAKIKLNALSAEDVTSLALPAEQRIKVFKELFFSIGDNPQAICVYIPQYTAKRIAAQTDLVLTENQTTLLCQKLSFAETDYQHLAQTEIHIISGNAHDLNVQAEIYSVGGIPIDKKIAEQVLGNYDRQFLEFIKKREEGQAVQQALANSIRFQQNVKRDLEINEHSIKNSLQVIKSLTEQYQPSLEKMLGTTIAYLKEHGIETGINLDLMLENERHLARALILSIIMGQNCRDALQDMKELKSTEQKKENHLHPVEKLLKHIDQNVRHHLEGWGITWVSPQGDEYKPLRYIYVDAVYSESYVAWKIFSNIIENSALILKEYNIANPTISLAIETEEKYVVSIIRDNGPGFSPEIIDKIYQAPIPSTKESSLNRTGKGTLQVGEITRDCGGKITATNLPTGGAETRVYLPRTTPEEFLEKISGRPPQTSSAADINKDIAPIRTKNILFVDDEGDIRESLTSLFKEQGFGNLSTASNPDEALAIIMRNPPDMITLDMTMGTETFAGLNLLQSMADAGIQNIPVLIITGSSGDDREIIAVALDEFPADMPILKNIIPKPFVEQTIFDIVTQTLLKDLHQ